MPKTGFANNAEGAENAEFTMSAATIGVIAGAFAAKDALELLEERFAVEFGADQDGIEVETLLVFVIEVGAGVDQNRKVLGFAMFFELGDDFVAAGARHLKVQNYQVHGMF